MIVYQITLRDHPARPIRDQLTDSLALSLRSALQHGWQCQEVPAVNGYALPLTWAKDHGITGAQTNLWSLSGTWGCLLSHLRLWKLCRALDQPICVAEQDAVFFRPPRDLPQCGSGELIKLQTLRDIHDTAYTGRVSGGLWLYIIGPQAADKLIKHLQGGGMVLPADKLVGSDLVQWRYGDDQGWAHPATLKWSSTSAVDPRFRREYIQWRLRWCRRSRSKNQR